MKNGKPYYAVSFLLILVAIIVLAKVVILPHYFSTPVDTQAKENIVPETSVAPVFDPQRATDQTASNQVETHIESASIPAAQVGVKQQQIPLMSNPPAMSLELRGTVTGPAQMACAFITDRATGSTGTYKIGDTISGGRIVAIEKDGVLLDFDGQTINLESNRSNSLQHVERDVSSVSIQGDSTLMGMRIENVDIGEGVFSVSTTGARFEYEAGQLKVFQGLDPTDRRLLSTITFENAPIFSDIEGNEDHILFWSPSINLGIYGDSTGIIAPKTKQYLGCRGHFQPDYEGRHEGELLLIDDKGGIEIYPQRYEAGYKVEKIELGKENWLVDYKLDAGERVMIAAFPGKPFDWEKSFSSNTVFTCGGMGLGVGNVYGEMPSDDSLRAWAENIDIVVFHYHGVYVSSSYKGPYIIANEAEFKRMVATAHEVGLKIVVYTTLDGYYRIHGEQEGYYQEIQALAEQYDIDGVYVDGVRCDIKSWEKNADNILSWEMMRRLRVLFGSDGAIVYHGTCLGGPVATVPNIDSYCDVTLCGENIPFSTIDDAYVQYQVRKYGISNTVGLWKPGEHPESITDKDIIDAMLSMNGRVRAMGYVLAAAVPANNKYIWRTSFGAEYDYYIARLKALEAQSQSIKDQSGLIPSGDKK